MLPILGQPPIRLVSVHITIRIITTSTTEYAHLVTTSLIQPLIVNVETVVLAIQVR
jgi:hypothetical protein